MILTFLISKRKENPDTFYYLKINILWDGTNVFTQLSFEFQSFTTLECNVKTDL